MNLLKSNLFSYKIPENLTCCWNFGFILAVVLNIQVFSGVLLSLKFKAGESLAFVAVRDIFTEENFGWAIRYCHSNGVSLYFAVMFIHIAKGMFYSSKFLYSSWYTGIAMLFISIATAFVGYVLPDGQMSFWGSVVIQNLIKWSGPLCILVFGSETIGEETYRRFFTYHYILPVIIYVFICLHIYYLHRDSSSNPLSIVDIKKNVKFSLKEMWNDLKNFLIVLIFAFTQIGFGCIKIFQADPENSIESDNTSTPEHIVPEWYLLLFYATLKVFPTKTSGLLAILGIVIVLIMLIESRSFSSFISCSFYHRCWTAVSNTFMSLVFIISCIGQMVVNLSLSTIGICAVILANVLTSKLLDTARIRLFK